MAQRKIECFLQDSVLKFSIGRTHIKVLSFDRTRIDNEHYSKTHARNHFEVHYVLSGRGFLDVGENRYELYKDVIYIAGPGLVYHRMTAGREPVYEYTMQFCIEGERFDREPKDMLTEKSFLICDDLSECGICFRRAEHELKAKHDFYAESIEISLKNIIIMMMRRYGVSEPAVPLPRAEKGDKCCLVADMEFVFNIREMTLGGLSDILGFSMRQCQRFIMENYGLSYSEKLLQARMIKASDYLIYTDKPIQHIGEEVGYSGNSYFTRVFKKYFGMSPRAYRKKYKEELVK